MAASHELIVVGTGFSSSFFLLEYLRRASPRARVLVLEAGERIPHAEQLGARRPLHEESSSHFVNGNPKKPWYFTRHFGGGSNCWFGTTPRLLPEDFRLRSTWGAGVDWPLTYDELEPYYAEVEEVMQVSGPDDVPYPMSRPYPQPPHRMTAPGQVLRAAHPGRYTAIATARPRLPVGSRPACCNNQVCSLCPVDAKFTVLNSLQSVYADPRVELRCSSPVRSLDLVGGRASGVVFRAPDGREERASGDLLVLGANALFNAHLLLRSGLEHPELGRGLCEQLGIAVNVELEGMDSFQGSTAYTSLGWMLASGEHRRHHAAALIHASNKASLIRNERGKWRARLPLVVVYEDLRQPENRVLRNLRDPDRPVVAFSDHSEYARRGAARVVEDLARVLAPLPLERIEVVGARLSESHLHGTTVMGDDPRTSVVDRDGVHHELRNVVVLGGGNFPTAPAANPTLTISALALRSARRLTT